MAQYSPEDQLEAVEAELLQVSSKAQPKLWPGAYHSYLSQHGKALTNQWMLLFATSSD